MPVCGIAGEREFILLIRFAVITFQRLPWSPVVLRGVRLLPHEPIYFDVGGQFVSSVDVSPDSTLLLTGGSDVRLWDLSTGALLEQFDFEATVKDVAFSRDGELFAVTTGWTFLLGQRGIWLYQTDNRDTSSLLMSS